MEKVEYAVDLKAKHDMTEADYVRGTLLCEEKYKTPYAIWFNSLEEAKKACIEHNGYGIIESEYLDYVWYNPHYQSEGIRKLSKYLGKRLLPKTKA